MGVRPLLKAVWLIGPGHQDRLVAKGQVNLPVADGIGDDRSHGRLNQIPMDHVEEPSKPVLHSAVKAIQPLHELQIRTRLGSAPVGQAFAWLAGCQSERSRSASSRLSSQNDVSLRTSITCHITEPRAEIPVGMMWARVGSRPGGYV